MTTKKVFNKTRKIRLLLLLAVFFVVSPGLLHAQVLFVEDCFVGGVTVTGANTSGVAMGVQADVRWEPGFEVRRIYAVTHRLGWVAPHTMFVNGGAVHWDSSSQVGPETPLSNPWSHPFAVHVQDVTETVMIEDSVAIIDLPPQQFYDNAWNWGWWSIYLVILYEAPHIDQEICYRLYTADQRQDMVQNFQFATPLYLHDSPLLLSLFSTRLMALDSDKSRVWLNDEVLGDLRGNDLTVPPTQGAQGHFYYESNDAKGLTGDTANGRFFHHDAVALLNGKLSNESQQNLSISKLTPLSGDPGDNLHPAFTLVYTPSCPVISTDDMVREYELCQGDSVQLSGVSGFDHYSWYPGTGLSDSAAAAPLCSPDSSGWYMLSMRNNSPVNGCPQTVPVFVKVNPMPRPSEVRPFRSTCPEHTGTVHFLETGGTAPLTFFVGDADQENNYFDGIAPGTHSVFVEDAAGCRWDSTVTVGMRVPHTAAFTANPQTGTTPLQVNFSNQTQGATDYVWSTEGAVFSTAEHPAYTFADSGAFEVELIAFRGDTLCADTATITIFVDPGIELELPNIITPNGDGRNDRLIARVLGARSLRWEVFNRWGQSMHSGEAATSPFIHEEVLLWDPPQTAPSGGNRRTSRPEASVSDGVYMLVLFIEGIAGNTEEVKQTVTVAR